MDPDFDKPISLRPDKPKPRFRFDGVAALAFLGVATLAVVGGWALFVDDPLGGEPVATAAIERRAPARPAGEEPQKSAAADHGVEQPQKSRDGVPIVRPGDAMPKTGPVIIQVPGSGNEPVQKQAALRTPSGAVDPAMLEDSRYGQLPRVATDGRRPADAYGRPAAADKGPRVALVVGGLGVGREATLAALDALPAEVTLAFSPYGSEVPDFVARARKGGHEVLIQAPMEPFAYPSNDPGPQTLLTSLPASANLERLRWALGRATGYVGVAQLSGGSFMRSDDALAPVFTEIARRGLIFVGQADRESRFGEVADRSGLAVARAAVPVDASLDAASIDLALADLERSAKDQGFAVGWAGASPLTVKRIEAWRAGLSQRGVTLVPVTAALKPQGPS